MTENFSRHGYDTAAMHKIIMELEYWIGEIALAAISLNKVNKDDSAELYRLLAKTLQGRVNALVFDYGRPSLDVFRLEQREGIKSEHFPPVDLFEILADPFNATTQFVTAVGDATQ